MLDPSPPHGCVVKTQWDDTRESNQHDDTWQYGAVSYTYLIRYVSYRIRMSCGIRGHRCSGHNTWYNTCSYGVVLFLNRGET